jgi:hypothetical protein
MPTPNKFVGSGGLDTNNGTSWATRRLTLTGIEAIVAAGDVVNVDPGVYPETLTLVTTGTSGSPITYIADLTGVYSGTPGEVRITGSNDSKTPTRSNCIVGSGQNYRIFRGFTVDGVTGDAISINPGTHWEISDLCAEVFIRNGTGDTGVVIHTQGDVAAEGHYFHRIWAPFCQYVVLIDTVVSNTAMSLQNIVSFSSGESAVIQNNGCGGVTISNVSLVVTDGGLIAAANIASGQSQTLKDSIIVGSQNSALSVDTAARFTENYNNVFGNGTARSVVGTGANSNAWMTGWLPAVINLSGVGSLDAFALASWSPLIGAGTVGAPDDLWGIARVTNDMGAVAFTNFAPPPALPILGPIDFWSAF